MQVVQFRGPYADGPPDEALRINAPDLTTFGVAEIVRLITIGAVLGWTTARSLIGWLFQPRGRTAADAFAEGLVDGFEELGPTFVKFGQFFASSPGFFPQPLADACLRCLDDVAPMPSHFVREIIYEDLGHEPEEILLSFDPEPLSAASVGQVHACVLADGREAVIKLQRPEIKERMTTDLRLMYQVGRWLQEVSETVRRMNITGAVEELRQATFQELNCALEAKRLDRFHAAVHSFADNDWVVSPRVYWEYCGPRMICMERMSGLPLDSFEDLSDKGVDTTLALRRGVKAWIESVLIGEEFHGDVHAGNVWILDDGRSCFLDFGIMGTLPEEWRESVRDAFYAVMIDGDFSRIARSLKRLGVLDAESCSDQEIGLRLQLMFGPMLTQGLSQISFAQIGKMLIDLSKQYNGTAPRELVLVVKQLAYFERYAKALAPDWVLTRDLYLVRNVFPEEVERKASELGISLPA